MSNITFNYFNTQPVLTHRRKIKLFLKHIFNHENRIIKKVDIIFCTDEYLLKLNKRFLNHGYYTDTITFIYEQDPIVGEVYISIDTLKSNALRFNVKLQTELLRVIIHGCLHLCGYSDKPKKEAQEMNKVQEHYLNELLVSRETN